MSSNEIFSVVCNVVAVRSSLFNLPLGEFCRHCSVFVALRVHFIQYLTLTPAISTQLV